MPQDLRFYFEIYNFRRNFGSKIVYLNLLYKRNLEFLRILPNHGFTYIKLKSKSYLNKVILKLAFERNIYD